MDRLDIVPITQKDACAFVAMHHRHHLPPLGSIFQVAVARSDKVVGVLIVGRPVARHLDNGLTVEVLRCCTLDEPESKHAASKLYAAARRVALALGYHRMITYTLASEAGTSLRAAGWRAVYQTAGGAWGRASRPRIDRHPTGAKTLWEAC